MRIIHNIPITHVIHIIHIILHIIHLIRVINIIQTVYMIHDTHQLVSRFLIRHPRHRDGILAGIADNVTAGQKNCGVVRNQNDASLVLLEGAEATGKSVQ